MKARTAIGFAALSLAMSSCGGGDVEPADSITATSAPATSTTATSAPGQADPNVGSNGGRVTSEDGRFVVEIPAGALVEPVAISIAIVPAAEADVDESLLAGPIYSLLPDGLEFQQPVTLVRTLDAADLQAGDDEIPFFHVLHSSVDGWEPLSTNATRHGDVVTITAEADHFSMDAAVETTLLLGEEITATLFPASFEANVGESRDTAVSLFSSAQLAEDEDSSGGRVLFFPGGAIVSYGYDDQPLPTLFATCGEDPGSGTYTARINDSFGLIGADSIVRALISGFNQIVETEQFTISVTGNATCVEPDLSLIESVLGTWSGPLVFTPSPTGPAGVEYTAEFDVELMLRDGQFVLTKVQRPSNQMTVGAMLPDSLTYVAEGGDGYYEIYVGQACLLGDGDLMLFGLSFGGSPDLAEQAPAILETQMEITYDPATGVFVFNDRSLPVDPLDCPTDQAAAMPLAENFWPVDVPATETGANFFSFFSGRLERP